jgi:hypothetical protein
MLGDDALRRALVRKEQIDEDRRAKDEGDMEYTRAKARELADVFHAFLRAMKAAGNPGLERRPGSFFSRRSWGGWVYPDGTVAEGWDETRKSPEEYAFDVLRRTPRDGWGANRRRHVSQDVESITRRLADILAANKVEPPRA